MFLVPSDLPASDPPLGSALFFSTAPSYMSAVFSVMEDVSFKMPVSFAENNEDDIIPNNSPTASIIDSAFF
jgi:hypothetical protein